MDRRDSPCSFFSACLIPVPDRLAARLGYNAVLLEGLHHSAMSIAGVAVMGASFVVSVMLLRKLKKTPASEGLIPMTSIAIASILTSLSSVVLPSVLSAKSDKPVAEEIMAISPEGALYMYVDEPMLRYYTANFYLNDRFKLLETNNDSEGLLLTGEFDLPALHEKYDGRYEFEAVKSWEKRSCDTRQPMVLLKFKTKAKTGEESK